MTYEIRFVGRKVGAYTEAAAVSVRLDAEQGTIFHADDVTPLGDA